MIAHTLSRASCSVPHFVVEHCGFAIQSPVQQLHRVSATGSEFERGTESNMAVLRPVDFPLSNSRGVGDGDSEVEDIADELSEIGCANP